MFYVALFLEDILVFFSFFCFTYKYFSLAEGAKNRSKFLRGCLRDLNIFCGFARKSESIWLISRRIFIKIIKGNVKK